MVPVDEFEWRFSRAGGPGGQGVNTADSRVQLTWDIAGSRSLDETQRARLLDRLRGRLTNGALTVTAADDRSQLRNRAAAVARLQAIVSEALAPPPRTRRATRPTRGSVERRIAGKRQRSQTKQWRRSTDE